MKIIIEFHEGQAPKTNKALIAVLKNKIEQLEFAPNRRLDCDRDTYVEDKNFKAIGSFKLRDTDALMMLTLERIVSRERRRSFIDNRRLVHYWVASYRGEDGYEYRKSFESYNEPNVPKRGENKDITAQQKQW